MLTSVDSGRKDGWTGALRTSTHLSTKASRASSTAKASVGSLMASFLTQTSLKVKPSPSLMACPICNHADLLSASCFDSISCLAPPCVCQARQLAASVARCAALDRRQQNRNLGKIGIENTGGILHMGIVCLSSRAAKARVKKERLSSRAAGDL